MKRIRFNKIVNRALLTEQLFEAFPNWKKIDPLGRGFNTTSVIVTAVDVAFPDETDESAVQAIIDAHDSGVDSVIQREKKDRDKARGEMANLPAWLDNLNFENVENHIQNNTVGNVTREQALALVDSAGSFNDVKEILRGLVNAVYGLVGVSQRIARVVLIVVFYLKRRL